MTFEIPPDPKILFYKALLEEYPLNGIYDEAVPPIDVFRRLIDPNNPTQNEYSPAGLMVKIWEVTANPNLGWFGNPPGFGPFNDHTKRRWNRPQEACLDWYGTDQATCHEMMDMHMGGVRFPEIAAWWADRYGLPI